MFNLIWLIQISSFWEMRFSIFSNIYGPMLKLYPEIQCRGHVRLGFYVKFVLYCDDRYLGFSINTKSTHLLKDPQGTFHPSLVHWFQIWIQCNAEIFLETPIKQHFVGTVQNKNGGCYTENGKSPLRLHVTCIWTYASYGTCTLYTWYLAVG